MGHFPIKGLAVVIYSFFSTKVHNFQMKEWKRLFVKPRKYFLLSLITLLNIHAVSKFFIQSRREWPISPLWPSLCRQTSQTGARGPQPWRTGVCSVLSEMPGAHPIQGLPAREVGTWTRRERQQCERETGKEQPVLAQVDGLRSIQGGKKQKDAPLGSSHPTRTLTSAIFVPRELIRPLLKA